MTTQRRIIQLNLREGEVVVLAAALMYTLAELDIGECRVMPNEAAAEYAALAFLRLAKALEDQCGRHALEQLTSTMGSALDTVKAPTS